MSPKQNELMGKAERILRAAWEALLLTQESSGPTGGTSKAADRPQQGAILQDKLIEAIRRCINSQTKTYRYVLPTHIVAKLADPSLDCRCVQIARGGAGAFDARSLCHQVIVPFDRDNHSVLGGSGEPYVNNPLRVPEISAKYRPQQRDRDGWDDLCFVLEQVQTKNDGQFTDAVFKQVLAEIAGRLSSVHVVYPAPKRISLSRTMQILEAFLSIKSSGDRALAVSAALLKTVGERFRLFSDVRRRNINAPDASTGLVADIECVDGSGHVLLAAEVKDMELTLIHVQGKLPAIREKRVSEILFLVQKGVSKKDAKSIDDLVNKEFTSGQNIYIFDLLNFASTSLTLLGEDGRRQFVKNVGDQLDTYGSGVLHRKGWADLLWHS